MFQTLNDRLRATLSLPRLHIEIERPRKDHQNARHPIIQMQLDPRRQLLPQPRRTDTKRPNPTTSACVLQFRNRELIDAFSVDGLVVTTELEETGADGAAEEVVGSEGVETHVAAGGDELGTGEVVEGEVIVEELGYVDDVLF